MAHYELAEKIVALVVLGVVNTAFAYVVYVRLIHTAGAVFASLNNYLVPVFGLVVGAVALSEPVTKVMPEAPEKVWLRFSVTCTLGVASCPVLPTTSVKGTTKAVALTC